MESYFSNRYIKKGLKLVVMKVLWVTNTIFPDLAKSLGNNAPVIGGWMYGLANDLKKNGTNLFVATASQNLDSSDITINEISYYLLKGEKPLSKYDTSLENQWKKIIDTIKPDVIHIHGTEYAHGLSLMKSCPNENYVISIQGLVSVIARYYTGKITNKQIRKNKTFRDFVRKDSIINAQKKLVNRGESVEKKYFKLCKHFIGRTQWDYDHSVTLNKNISYHFCNESLRDTFYTSEKWNVKTKKNHTIFLSQASYPIKGFHQVIKAIAFLKDEFPNIKIRIAGDNILKHDTLKDKIRLSGYGKYLINLLKDLNLQDNIQFMGFLDEKKMIQEYLNCNVFICPSSIENSPNSIGEAQLLGVPCIASYVGGVPDMVEHGKTGLLYRFEEVEMLAQLIKTIFTNSELAQKIAQAGMAVATQRHNRETNLNSMLSIYSEMMAK